MNIFRNLIPATCVFFVLASGLAAQNMPPKSGRIGTLEDGIRELATTLAERMPSDSVQKIAIVGFSSLTGYKSALELFVAEDLTTQLLEVNPGGFDVVERQQLAKVLEEQSLSASALFDPETIANVGEILGIDVMITGTIADLGDEIKINARSISVQTAKIFAVASAKAPKVGVVDTLMRQSSAPSLRGPASSSAPVGRQVQASDVFFQSDFLRLTVESLALPEEGDRATLALQMENLTTEPLFLALEYARGYRVRLVDNQGLELVPRSVAGLAGSRFSDSSPAAEQFTRVAPKGRTVLVVTFEPGSSQDKSTGTVFAVAANFLRFENGVVSRFAAGISNIEIGR